MGTKLTEQKVINVALILIALGIIIYSSRFRLLTNSLFVMTLYLPLVIYSMISLTDRYNDRYVLSLNTALTVLYVILFLEIILDSNMSKIGYGLAIFIIPAIFLIYLFSENKFDQKEIILYYLKATMVSSAFILTTLILDYEAYIVLFVAVNVALFVFLLIDVIINK